MMVRQITKTEFIVELDETEDILIGEICEFSGRDRDDQLSEIFVKGLTAAGLD